MIKRRNFVFSTCSTAGLILDSFLAAHNLPSLTVPFMHRRATYLISCKDAGGWTEGLLIERIDNESSLSRAGANEIIPRPSVAPAATANSVCVCPPSLSRGLSLKCANWTDPDFHVNNPHPSNA